MRRVARNNPQRMAAKMSIGTSQMTPMSNSESKSLDADSVPAPSPAPAIGPRQRDSFITTSGFRTLIVALVAGCFQPVA